MLLIRAIGLCCFLSVLPGSAFAGSICRLVNGSWFCAENCGTCAASNGVCEPFSKCTHQDQKKTPKQR
jgi:hypothetical protein